MTTPLRTLVATLLVLLSACGTTRPSHFYALAALPSESAARQGEIVWRLDPVEVADYLQRPQLVRRTGAVELDVDDYHRWAEPVDHALTRVLELDLRRLVGSPAPYSYSSAVTLVRCEVSRFEEDLEGNAVLEVGYRVAPHVDLMGAQLRTWVGHAQLAHPRDPAELAAALNGLVHEFARVLAGELAEAATAGG